MLEALRFVLDPDFKPSTADCNMCSPERPVSVTIHCTRLNAMERDSCGGTICDADDSIHALTRNGQC